MGSELDAEFARFEAEMKELESKNLVNEIPKEETNNKKRKSATITKTEVIVAEPKRNLTADLYYATKETNIPAALSGFIPGTSGTEASDLSQQSRLNASVISSKKARFDMTTGQPLPLDVQHQITQQQSIYDYDPSKVASTKEEKQKKYLRAGGGNVWYDPTLSEWPDNDFRLFCGDLGNEVTDEMLAHAFASYGSFQRAKVVREKFSHKTKGYGFVSFADPFDCAKAMREMNGKYIGNRPVKLQKSTWHERDYKVAKKKQKKKGKKNHLFA